MKKQRRNYPRYAVQMRKGRGDPWHDVTEPLFIEEAFRVRRKLIDALDLPDDTNIGLQATVRVGGIGTTGLGILGVEEQSLTASLGLPRQKRKGREYRRRMIRKRAAKDAAEHRT